MWTLVGITQDTWPTPDLVPWPSTPPPPHRYAPMPAPKLKKVLSSIDEAKTFLKDNK